MKRQAIALENTYQNKHLIKDLYSLVRNELLKLNIKKSNNSMQRKAEDPKRHLNKKDI